MDVFKFFILYFILAFYCKGKNKFYKNHCIFQICDIPHIYYKYSDKKTCETVFKNKNSLKINT